MSEFSRVLCWLRRDLRVHDQAALAAALERADEVFCAFVFDTAILDRLENPADRRVEFILAAVGEVDQALQAYGGGLIVRHADARELIPRLAETLRAEAVFVNRDYEPAAKRRDARVRKALAQSGIGFFEYQDQVIFGSRELRTRSGGPFAVYTPYRRAWLAALDTARLAPRVVRLTNRRVGKDPDGRPLPTLEALGFRKTNLDQIGIATGMSGAKAMFEAFRKRIGAYANDRDSPAVDGTSNLSVHLRFGTISIRTLAAEAHALSLAGHSGSAGAATWLSELIWRDFYFAVLDAHPEVVAHAFKREFDRIPFPNDRGRFQAWCAGRTGYPLVDAGMRQLATTGMMHNRLRMITASFLVKDLHVDWRWGERHFAAHLNDYDLAANNGGWQWAASTGTDAQPYFRIFNPVTQSERFDHAGTYIRRHVPELANVPNEYIHAPWKMPPLTQQEAGIAVGRDYPAPIVDHDVARKRALELFRVSRTGTP